MLRIGCEAARVTIRERAIAITILNRRDNYTVDIIERQHGA